MSKRKDLKTRVSIRKERKNEVRKDSGHQVWPQVDHSPVGHSTKPLEYVPGGGNMYLGLALGFGGHQVRVVTKSR